MRHDERLAMFGEPMTENISIPLEALAVHTAILGMTGGGKTSTAKLAIEEIVARGARVCILDPVKSDWWGITSSADGLRPGLPFSIIGGPRGHVPLHSGAGKALAEIVARGDLKHSIIDMREFEPGGHAKFFADFAHTLLQRIRGVLYLVIEEAHLFAPKERSGMGVETHAIHYAKMLATAGRSTGIRLMLLSQRVQALHNALLGSCATLIAHNLSAPADQEPVVKWLMANAGKELGKEIAASLATLPTGTGWLCNGPHKIFRRVAFPRISTYDNTKTPEDDDSVADVTTAPIDMSMLRAVIGTAVEEAKANDPEELKKQIADLQRKLAAAAKGSAPSSDDEKQEAAALEDIARAGGYEDGLADGRKAGFAEGVAQIGTLMQAVVEQGEAWVGLARTALQEAQGAAPPAHVARRIVATGYVTAAAPAAAPATRPRAARADDGSLHSAARAMLTALAQHAPARFTWQQTATLAGLKARGGHYNAGRKDLLDRQLVTDDGGLVAASKAGLKEAGTVPPKPSSPQEIVDMWCGRLPSPAPEMLRYIVQQGGRAVPRDELATALQKQPHGGHWNSGIANLRNNGLVEMAGTAMRAAALLLGGKR
jgi:hypothetical protein